jgi:hypothetical protein
MITVLLRGGLGNQMFQYAVGLSLAEKSDRSFSLDTVFLTDRFPRLDRDFAYRNFDLDIFALTPKFTLLSSASQKIPIPGFWLVLDGTSAYGKDLLGAKPIIKERKEHVFDAEILNIKRDVALWGFWQNEKYFQDIESKLREAFRFRHPLEGEVKEFAVKIVSSESVSLHVRRGDYRSTKTSAVMAEMTPAYYQEAARTIATKVSNPEFFVFSDDIEWCKANITLDFPATYVPASVAGPKASFHMELMSLCKHNIIANSTFSWWAAWLNSNKAKIVIAPKSWYVDGRDFQGMIPDGWIKL